MASIYAVDVPTTNNQHTRYVVLADSATEAELQVRHAERNGDARIEYEVGRLGAFDPGMAGAAMVQTSIIAIQRPAFESLTLTDAAARG